MTEVLAIPTARDEDWRYADFAVLQSLTPQAFGVWNDVALKPGETRRHCTVLDDRSAGLNRVRIDVAEGARAEMFAVLSASTYTRLEVQVRLARGARFEFGGVTIGGGDATREIVTRVTHAEPDATSRQVVRAVHWGTATGNFLGKVGVARAAQKTDAGQDFKGLLLERGASANAKPELEIFADDVKCAHGAAVGQLDEAARFYMAARGLPPEIADKLLVRAFIADAFAGLGDAAEQDKLLDAALTALGEPGVNRVAIDRKADFPGLVNADGSSWHYLDSAATAQKPQAVIDAVTRAIGRDYATVHRGVYTRSAEMTLGYEVARRRVAEFVGGEEDELVFTRGATEAINLVAHCWPEKGRVLLSELEHHSNIVPWQLAGWDIDVVPLTHDGRIDLEAAERMLTPAHTMVAFAHVSNVLGSVLDAPRAAALAHAVGAKLLLDGCQAVPRMAVDVTALECDFYAFSGHKLYGPTGIGALWSKHLDAMPPYQGGGSMIDKVTFARTTYAQPPQRFEAGTPAIVEAIGLAVACDYVTRIGLDTLHKREAHLVALTREALRGMNDVTLFGPENSAGIVSFALRGIHPHDLGTILDEENVAIRAGHHCAQPLMERLGVPATARASFGLYSDEDDVAALVRGIERAKRIFA